MGLTLFYGLVIAMPAAALIAFTWPRLAFVKKRMNPSVPLSLISDRDLPEGELPSFGTCMFIALVRVVLIDRPGLPRR